MFKPNELLMLEGTIYRVLAYCDDERILVINCSHIVYPRYMGFSELER